MAISKKSSKFEGSVSGMACGAVALGALMAAGARGGNYIVDKGKQAWKAISDSMQDQEVNNVKIQQNADGSTSLEVQKK